MESLAEGATGVGSVDQLYKEENLDDSRTTDEEEEGEYHIEGFYETTQDDSRHNTRHTVAQRYEKSIRTNGSDKNAQGNSYNQSKLTPTLREGRKFVSEFDHSKVDEDHEYSGNIPEGSQETPLVYLNRRGSRQSREEHEKTDEKKPQEETAVIQNYAHDNEGPSKDTDAQEETSVIQNYANDNKGPSKDMDAQEGTEMTRNDAHDNESPSKDTDAQQETAVIQGYAKDNEGPPKDTESSNLVGGTALEIQTEDEGTRTFWNHHHQGKSQESFSSLLSGSSDGKQSPSTEAAKTQQGQKLIPNLMDLSSLHANSQANREKMTPHPAPSSGGNKGSRHSATSQAGSKANRSGNCERSQRSPKPLSKRGSSPIQSGRFSISQLRKGGGRPLSGAAIHGDPKGRRMSYDHVKPLVPSRRASVSSPVRRARSSSDTQAYSDASRKLSFANVEPKVPSRWSKFKSSPYLDPTTDPAVEARKRKQRRGSVDMAFGRSRVYRRLSLTKHSGYYSQLPVSKQTSEAAGGTTFIKGHLYVPTSSSEALEALSKSIDLGDAINVYSESFLSQMSGRRPTSGIDYSYKLSRKKPVGRDLWDCDEEEHITPRQKRVLAEARSHKPTPFGPGMVPYGETARKATRKCTDASLKRIAKTEIEGFPREHLLEHLVGKSLKRVPGTRYYDFVRKQIQEDVQQYEKATQMSQQRAQEMVELPLVIHGPGFGLEFCAPTRDVKGSEKGRKGAILSKISKWSLLCTNIKPGCKVYRINGTKVVNAPFQTVLTKIRSVASKANASNPQTMTLLVTRFEKSKAELGQVKANYSEALSVYRDSVVWEELNRDTILHRSSHKESPGASTSTWNPGTKLWSFNRRFWGGNKMRRWSVQCDQSYLQGASGRSKRATGHRDTALLSAGLDQVVSAWNYTRPEDDKMSNSNQSSFSSVKAPQLYAVFEPMSLPTGKSDVYASVLASKHGEYVDVTCCSVPLGIKLRGKSADVQTVMENSLVEGLVFAGDKLVRIGSVDLRDTPATDVPAILQAACRFEKKVSKDSPLSLRFWRSYDSPHSVLSYAQQLTSAMAYTPDSSETEEEKVHSKDGCITVKFFETPIGVIARKNFVEKVAENSPASRYFEIGDKLVQVNQYYVDSNFQQWTDAVKVEDKQIPTVLRNQGRELAKGNIQCLRVTVVRERKVEDGDIHHHGHAGESSGLNAVVRDLKSQMSCHNERPSTTDQEEAAAVDASKSMQNVNPAHNTSFIRRLEEGETDSEASKEIEVEDGNNSLDSTLDKPDDEAVGKEEDFENQVDDSESECDNTSVLTEPQIIAKVTISPGDISDAAPRQEFCGADTPYFVVKEVKVPFTEMPLQITFSEEDVCFGRTEPHFTQVFATGDPLRGIFVSDIHRTSPAFNYVRPGSLLKRVNEIDVSRSTLDDLEGILKLSECHPTEDNPLVLTFYEMEDSTPTGDLTDCYE